MSSAFSTALARLESERERTCALRARATVPLENMVGGGGGCRTSWRVDEGQLAPVILGCGDETLAAPDHAAWRVGPWSVES